MTLRSLITLSLILLTLVACDRNAAPSPDAQTSVPSPEPSVGESPLSPPATATPVPPENASPLPDPSSSPIEPPSEGVDQVVAAAKDHLAAELDIASEVIKATAIVPVDWPDTSLGCPEPGMSYAQVVTPGYRMVLEVDGQEYELHTDRSGRTIVICERQLETGAVAGVAHLASELGISAEEIEVLSVEMYEWPDTSLGCPEPGKMYAQVVTPGYRIILSAQGTRYDVRTDTEGKIRVICEPEP